MFNKKLCKFCKKYIKNIPSFTEGYCQEQKNVTGGMCKLIVKDTDFCNYFEEK